MSQHDIVIQLAIAAYLGANLFLALTLVGIMNSDAEPGTKVWGAVGTITTFLALNAVALNSF